MKTNLTATVTSLTASTHQWARSSGALVLLISACAWLAFGGLARGQDAPTVPEFAPDQPSVTAQPSAAGAAITDSGAGLAADPNRADDGDGSDADKEKKPKPGDDPGAPGNLPGISFTGWIPPDPIIAAGPASLVAMVNSRIAIFDKKGTKFFEQDLSGSGGFWGAQGAGTPVGDPWVIFDPNSSRFIAIAADFGTSKGFLYLAVSKTATPIGSGDWYKYALNLTGTHVDPNYPGQPTFPDYPKAGVDGDAVYITANHFGINAGVPFSHAQILAIEKAPLLSGGAVNIVYNEPSLPLPQGGFSIHPTVVYEPAPVMYFVKAGGVSDAITVHVLDLSAGSRTAWLVPVSLYNNPPDVPQLGGGVPLDSVDRRIMSGVVRNGSLWTSHAIQDPAVDLEAVVRWYQFDITGAPGSAPTLVQSGNVDPGPDIHTWMSHINVDASGNMGIGFSVGGPNQYAAIGYTGRLASDPPGATYPVQTAKAGEGNYQRVASDGRNRWGDYSGLAMDPDGCTFWIFHEYPTAANQWQTFIGAFQADSCPIITIAQDGFESGNFSGGTGWAGAWSATGDISISSSGAAVGTRHVRLRRNTGLLRRSVNIPATAVSARLVFWAKVHSFEGNDRAYVRVSGSPTPLWTFTPTLSDNQYHYYAIDVTSFLGASPLQVEFDAEMNATNDNWYLDDIQILGTE